MRNIEKYHRV